MFQHFNNTYLHYYITYFIAFWERRIETQGIGPDIKFVGEPSSYGY